MSFDSRGTHRAGLFARSNPCTWKYVRHSCGASVRVKPTAVRALERKLGYESHRQSGLAGIFVDGLFKLISLRLKRAPG
jgi:hypothetical protein